MGAKQKRTDFERRVTAARVRSMASAPDNRKMGRPKLEPGEKGKWTDRLSTAPRRFGVFATNVVGGFKHNGVWRHL